MYFAKSFVILFVLYYVACAEISIVPQPAKIQINEGVFTFEDTTYVVVDSGCVGLGQYCAGKMVAVGDFEVVSQAQQGNKIVLRIEKSISFSDPQGYKLVVTPNQISISSASTTGVFYGIETLRQLLPAEIYNSHNRNNIDWKIPCVTIMDYPRFKWRGLHLDVSRHFMSVEYIKKQLDLMAVHKLNKFHWHLVDDQGWRLEIAKYPRLTSVGAYRNKTQISKGYKNSSPQYENSRYGGYYTKDEVREIVQYAQERFIEIIPEIEMPGHCSAALAAYPELSCSGEQLEVPGNWGIFVDVYCVGSEKVFEFNENVLREVFELFPSNYIHIGGDEVLKNNWKKCPRCQARMRSENLTTVDEMQSYFIKRIERFLLDNNKKMIGWDEILEGGIASEATLMCWRDEKYAVEAAELGHDVIMTPRWYCYFDYYQDNPAREPLAGGRAFLPLDMIYSYDPLKADFSKQTENHVLGVQANVWTEWIRGENHAEYMTWPRACALAEVGWTSRQNKNWDDFEQRMVTHGQRLEALNVNYHKKRDITKPSDVIRFMTYNVLYGGEADRGYQWYRHMKPVGYSVLPGNRTENLIKVIKSVNPDVLFLQECTYWTEDNNKLLNNFAEKLGMNAVISPNHNKFKVAILSRFPLKNVRWLDDNIKYYHNIIYADVEYAPGQKVTVASTHFGWWGESGWKDFDADAQRKSYIRQQNILLYELSQHMNQPFVMAGDFNNTCEQINFDYKPVYSEIANLGYTDSCFKIYRDYSRVCSGIEADISRLGPIDFIFVSPELSLNIVNADILYSVDAYESSDHLPVWTDIKLGSSAD